LFYFIEIASIWFRSSNKYKNWLDFNFCDFQIPSLHHPYHITNCQTITYNFRFRFGDILSNFVYSPQRFSYEHAHKQSGMTFVHCRRYTFSLPCISRDSNTAKTFRGNLIAHSAGKGTWGRCLIATSWFMSSPWKPKIHSSVLEEVRAGIRMQNFLRQTSAIVSTKFRFNWPCVVVDLWVGHGKVL
jgi:hypothetical protein